MTRSFHGLVAWQSLPDDVLVVREPCSHRQAHSRHARGRARLEPCGHRRRLGACVGTTNGTHGEADGIGCRQRGHH